MKGLAESPFSKTPKLPVAKANKESRYEDMGKRQLCFRVIRVCAKRTAARRGGNPQTMASAFQLADGAPRPKVNARSESKRI